MLLEENRFFANPLPLKKPLLLLSAFPCAESLGGARFKNKAIEKGDIEPKGVARDADKKASRLIFCVSFLVRGSLEPSLTT